MLTFSTPLIIALLGEYLDQAEGLHEAYGELVAEYRGEIARFGDAWPGSAAQVAGMAAAVAEVDRVTAVLHLLDPPDVVFPPARELEDCPF